MARRLALVVLLALIGATTTATSAFAAATTCHRTYSYAGVDSPRRAHGVAAVITPLAAPAVANGHVAAWVGVGGVGLGPGGSTEWIQAGLMAGIGEGAYHLYYEVTLPHRNWNQFTLKETVATGELHTIAVLEMAMHPGWWRIWVDGKPATKGIFLPASHGTWYPQVTAESWNGGTGACNGFSYRFGAPRIAHRAGGAWQPLSKGKRYTDPGFTWTKEAVGRFLALTRF